MPNAQQRMEILLRLERGEITPADAEQLLSGMQDLPPAATTRMGILEQVERGQLSADEATQRLLQQPTVVIHEAQNRARDERTAFENEHVSVTPIKPKQSVGRVLLIIGLVITIGSALWMGNILQRSGMNFWFFCLWLPFAMGLATVVIGWVVRSGEWMRVRVGTHKPGKHTVNVDMPLPSSVVETFIKNSTNWFRRKQDETPRSEER